MMLAKSIFLAITLLSLVIALDSVHLRHRYSKHQKRDNALTKSDTNEPDCVYFPTYHRKHIGAHNDGTTCHHFHKVDGYSPAKQQACSSMTNDTSLCSDDEIDQEDDAEDIQNSHVGVPFRPEEGDETHPDIDNRADDHGGNPHDYKLIKSYSGKTFFDDFYFYNRGDPTGGMIENVDKKTARRLGLIGTTKRGHAFMRIGHAKNGIHKSVRISTLETFTTGIIILDIYHIPVGCGVWPSAFTLPQNAKWPSHGEIDIIEGVHYYNRNMYSLHALSSCRMPKSVNMKGRLAMPNDHLKRNCDPHMTDDQGCGIKSAHNGDYGVAFNKHGGGVFALEWSEVKGVAIYFFPRHAIPQDIRHEKPDPSSWKTPQAFWPASTCPPGKYLSEHVAVFTNVVCGTWAGDGDVWWHKMGGQKFTCAKHTGKKSCYDYMRSEPDLSRAFWEIASVKIYQTKRRR